MRGAWIETNYRRKEKWIEKSPPVRGAWIETRSPASAVSMNASPPVRGAWIETTKLEDLRTALASRPPCGGRGLKRCSGPGDHNYRKRRPPCGGRGLKLLMRRYLPERIGVAPRAGGVD